ncbi:alcohol acetyltransferase [Phascolomyces articulosus]|uniref:Alcohol acetyltransferase n=1 Tax=Phascolomyces articulosus TaxID=60185 RepID=A0AAD5PEI8_9FUNG|nr:alcohol acetyltransferase [Phascolomyces articulosus]
MSGYFFFNYNLFSASMSASTVERPLGLLEKYQVSKQLTQCYGTVTATAILRHSPRKSPDDLKEFYFSRLHAPLNRLVEKHPQLSLVVAESDKPTAHFIRLDQFNLSNIVKIDAADQVAFWDRSKLAKVIANECDHEFNLDDHTIPLWHLRICVHDDRLDECSITFTAHHVIADGKSLAIFWKALFQEIDQEEQLLRNTQEEGHDIIKPKVKGVLGVPYEDRNAPMPTMMNMMGVVSQMVAKKVLPNALTKRWFPQCWAGDYPGITDKSKARHDTIVRAIELGGTVWKEVCTTCRKHGVTPHAAIMTAIILAFNEVYPEVGTVSTGTPVNCRSFCNPPVSEEEMGNFVGAYNYTWKLTSQSLTEFWDIAKTYHTQLKANKGEAAKDAGLLKFLSKYPEDYCRFWYDHWVSNPTMHRVGGIELSDLGRFIPFVKEETNNIWQLESLWFCQSAQIFTTALNINSISTKDSMYATIGWQNGALDESKADAFGPLVIQNLQKCYQ